MGNQKESKWKFRGGRLCLEFTNTVDARYEENIKNSISFSIGKDKLNGYDDLVDWAKEVGILKEVTARQLILMSSQKIKEAKQIFDRAVALRESLFRIFRQITVGLKPFEPDIELLNVESAEARSRQKLMYESDKFSWKFETTANDLSSIIWPVSLSGIELLMSDEISRVRQCPGENCGWLFLDTSKNRSRQWCDMKDCGNLAKVHRFREKQR
ncbi:MAG: CGNR zinc finger domain-containing protein [Bacteroidota bacterium]